MKVTTLVPTIVGVFAIIGGLYAFDCNYTRAGDHQNLRERFERNLLIQDAKELRNRMWDIQRNVGEDAGKRTREYKEIEDERNMILRELER
jgi:hypothetical protein